MVDVSVEGETLILSGRNQKRKEKKLAKRLIVSTAFSEYQLLEQIGSGGNGAVYSVTDVEGNLYAIKFISSDISSSKRKRLRNEINFCENFAHPNIIHIIDHGVLEFEDKKYVFYVMPLYQETLRNKINADLQPEAIVTILTGILNGLQFAHKRGVIHRDVKPENILFEKDSNNPIICDFGIAHFSEELLITAVETKKEERLANFQYAAPEQRMKGSNSSPATDLYAVALMMNEMFTHQIPVAEGYLKIADIKPEYAFLDDLFSDLYKQEMSARLQSAEQVLTKMQVLLEKRRHDIEAEKMRKSLNQIVTPDVLEFYVEKIKYNYGALVFVMSAVIPEDWLEILKRGSFLHTYSTGYDTSRITRYCENEIGMPLKGSEGDNQIIQIVERVKQWIGETNRIYNRERSLLALREQAAKEERVRAEIEEMQQNDHINALLAEI